MAMEINGSYGSAQTSYLERLKEEQPLDKTSRAEELKAGQEEKTPAQDEYISSEKSGQSPPACTGLERTKTAIAKSFLTTLKSPVRQMKKNRLTKRQTVPRMVANPKRVRVTPERLTGKSKS